MKTTLTMIQFHFKVDGRSVLVEYKPIGPGLIRERHFATRFKVYVYYRDGIEWTVSHSPNKTNATRLLRESILSIQKSA